MKKYKVTIELVNDTTVKLVKDYIVDAGNKKIACIRATTAANIDGYHDCYKRIITVEEVEDNVD